MSTQKFVQVRLGDGFNYDFPCAKDGTLPMEGLVELCPGAITLYYDYYSPDSSSLSRRLVEKDYKTGALLPPVDGWKGKLFYCVYPFNKLKK